MTQLKSELSRLKLHMNDMEQYGRRNSIRLINYKIGQEKTESECIESVVRYINSKILPHDEVLISESDIERCHPVGEKQMLVKFASYQTKYKVYSFKSALKKNPDKVFMSEDLTKANHSVVKKLIPMRKSRQINSFWTNNGVIYVKKSQDAIPTKLSCDDDVNVKLNL